MRFAVRLNLWLSLSSVASALVIAPKFGVGKLFSPEKVGSRAHVDDISLRIRSTRESDLDGIATILATASIGAESEHLNFKQKLDVLRFKASMHTLLEQRFNVCRAGEEALAVVDQIDACEGDKLRMIWEHGSFVKKLQKAAGMSTEPHIWRDHNFALCPDDVCHLQHTMMTAEDASTGTIVGFCEVAMMCNPNSEEGNNHEDDYAPTIANLVTSTAYRRQGIGSSLVRSAARFVTSCWESEDIALFVHKENDRATALYNKLGFKCACSAGENDDKWYMTLRPTSRRRKGVAVERELVAL